MRPSGTRRALVALHRADPAYQVAQLFLAIAADEIRLRSDPDLRSGSASAPRAPTGVARQNAPETRGWGLTPPSSSSGSDPRSQAWQQVVQALEPAGGEHGLGGDDLDGLHIGQPRREIEVGVPQAVAVAGLVGDGDDQPPIGPRQRRRHQPLAQRVFVMCAQRLAPGFVAAKRRRKEPRLAQHALGAGIALRFGFQRQRLQHQPLERVRCPGADAARRRTARPPRR